jgi:hypothetical protein
MRLVVVNEQQVACAAHNRADAKLLHHRRVRLDHGGRVGPLSNESQNRAVARGEANLQAVVPAQALHEGVGGQVLDASFLRHSQRLHLIERQTAADNHGSLLVAAAAHQHQVFAPRTGGGHARPRHDGKLEMPLLQPLGHDPGRGQHLDASLDAMVGEQARFLGHVSRHLANTAKQSDSDTIHRFLLIDFFTDSSVPSQVVMRGSPRSRTRQTRAIDW